jgi:adenosylhomocysteine nucleosidase
METIGIMGAMPEEVEGIIDLMTQIETREIGKRIYHSGFINSKKCVVVFSRWGKVAAASTASTLIHIFGVKEIWFTGVAGAIDEKVKIGDIVIGEKLFQHDMDARPLINQFEIPLLNLSYFEMQEERKQSVFNKIKYALGTGVFFENIELKIRQEFEIENVEIHMGSIASGDQFFSTNQQKNKLSNQLPDVLCVEMEGSAVAQVCYENEIPFTIIRTISDAADDGSPLDFPRFVQHITKAYTTAMVKALI